MQRAISADEGAIAALASNYIDNVRAYAVRGSFDDCQRMVKQALGEPERSPHALSTANSISIGRLLPQVAYYASAAQDYFARHGIAPGFDLDGRRSDEGTATNSVSPGVRQRNRTFAPPPFS